MSVFENLHVVKRLITVTFLKTEIINGFFEHRPDFNKNHAISKMLQLFSRSALTFDYHRTPVSQKEFAGGRAPCRGAS